jgi:hypothetical protein
MTDKAIMEMLFERSESISIIALSVIISPSLHYISTLLQAEYYRFW